MVPDVAEPLASTYDAVVDEIGEAGVWALKVASGHVPERYATAAAGSFEAMVGQLMGAMGAETTTNLQQAMMRGDTEAFEHAGWRCRPSWRSSVMPSRSRAR